MSPEEIKKQARKEFDERFEYMSGGYYASRMGRHAVYPDDFKSFIDSLIDKTVQSERERIVGLIREATDRDHSKCPIKETCIGYQNCVSDIENGVIESLITNKSNINNLTE